MSAIHSRDHTPANTPPHNPPYLPNATTRNFTSRQMIRRR